MALFVIATSNALSLGRRPEIGGVENFCRAGRRLGRMRKIDLLSIGYREIQVKRS
jgi:hypothetical protein